MISSQIKPDSLIVNQIMLTFDIEKEESRQFQFAIWYPVEKFNVSYNET